MTLSRGSNRNEIQLRNEMTEKLLQYAHNMRNSGTFNDVVIKVGERCILANKMILSCFSKFFEKMFLSSFVERDMKTVTIQDLDGMSVAKTIDFIYSHQIDINPHNVMSLLHTSDFLQIDEVKTLCFEFLLTTCTVDSWTDVMDISIRYSNLIAEKKVSQYISSNFDEVMKAENFLQLQSERFGSVLCKLDQSKVHESLIFSALLNWIRYDKKREEKFEELFRKISLNRLSFRFVKEIVAKERLVKQFLPCLNAVEQYLCTKKADESKNFENLSNLFCVGGDGKKSVSKIFGESSVTYPDLPFAISHHCSLKVKEFIYCVGGIVDCKSNQVTNKAYRMNLKELPLKWQEIS